MKERVCEEGTGPRASGPAAPSLTSWGTPEGGETDLHSLAYSLLEDASPGLRPCGPSLRAPSFSEPRWAYLLGCAGMWIGVFGPQTPGSVAVDGAPPEWRATHLHGLWTDAVGREVPGLPALRAGRWGWVAATGWIHLLRPVRQFCEGASSGLRPRGPRCGGCPRASGPAVFRDGVESFKSEEAYLHSPALWRRVLGCVTRCRVGFGGAPYPL